MSFTEKELELIEVLKKYGNRGNLQKKRGPLYDKLRNTGRTDILDAALPSLLRSWNYETCLQDAKKYTLISHWQNASAAAYRVAKKNKWLNECTKHMKSPRKRWTLFECKQDALKYKTKKEWQQSPKTGYVAALKNCWIDKCCGHMVNPSLKWTFEKCQKKALKYKTRKEWQTKHQSSYASALRQNFLEQCCRHMSKNTSLRPVYCFETKKTYASVAEAGRKLKINRGNLIAQIKGERKTVGGYTFQYA